MVPNSLRSLVAVTTLFATLFTTLAGAECAKANPDGAVRSIAFTSDRKSTTGSLDIYLMDADGRGASEKLTDAPAASLMPAWSADGSGFAFVRSGLTGIPGIYLMDAGGVNETPLLTDLLSNTDPAWFPGGRRIVFSRSEDIYTATLGASGDLGEKPIRLTRNTNAERQPAVSPNGRKIAFASDRDGDFDVYLMNAAPESKTNRPVKLTRNQVDDFTLDWSPEGERIAFSHDTEGGREIYVMKAAPRSQDTNSPRNLTGDPADDSDPTWSPDGELIAFTSDRTGDDDIWRMRADGTDPTNLTRSPRSEDLQPAWRPLP
jgi:Tol biopolymer transport system component